MEKKCINCGSTDFMPDLKLLTEETTSGYRPVYVKLVQPKPVKAPFLWIAEETKSDFLAHICRQCGFTAIYAENFEQLSDADKKGFLSEI